VTTPRRQVPAWSQLAPLLKFRRFDWDATERRLSRCFTIADLRAAAKRHCPPAVFDYTDGAADAEIGLRRARNAFDSVEFQPSVLRDVSLPDTSCTILGRPSQHPFVFAPTGFTRLMHHSGERAVVAVAQRIGVPYALSTMGTTSIEEVAAAAPEARRWFQLYVWRDRSAAEELMKRASDSGYEALVLTVDAPIPGMRVRDLRNGFSIPPTLTLRTIAGAVAHPAWWMNMLTTEPLSFTSLASWDKSMPEMLSTLFDPSVTIADLEWIRSFWTGPLVIKGIQSVDDAVRVVDAGADAIVLSNHGGRQLDRAPVPLRLLPEVVRAVGGRTQIQIDTGVMSGADIVAALAFGADSVMVGRAYLYGLMAGGERGVQRAADILIAEIRRTMQFLGVRSIAELGPGHVRLVE